MVNRMTRSHQCRYFAKRPIQKTKKEPKGPRRSKKQVDNSSTMIPPAMLLPTGSRNVFVAKEAIDPSEAQEMFASLEQKHTTKHQFTALEPHDFAGNLHPDDSLPRIAFLGRSNVGKSSLLNALMKEKLAVTSKTPGRTRKVHYYGLGMPFKAYFVDLPGYGYAVGSDDNVQDWQRRTQQFLLRDTPPRRLFLLQDARVGIQEFDMTVKGWLEEAQIPYTVVLTKVDGARRQADVIRHVNEVCLRFQQQLHSESYVYQSPVVHVTSARLDIGLAELWESLEVELLSPII